MSLKAKLEAVIYAAEEPVTLAQLAALFGPDALEWKAAREAVSSNSEAAPAETAQQVETVPLLNAEFDDQQMEQPSVPPPSEGVAGEPPAEPIPEALPTVVSVETGSEAGPEAGVGPGGATPADDVLSEASGAAAEANAEPTTESAADPEAEAKRLARQRDRDVRTILRGLLDELIATCASDDRGIEIKEIAGGYRMATKPECHDAARAFVKSLKPALKLSLPALETLAVVAYKQPVTAPEVNEIRGVESSGVFGSLLARKLIATAGRKQVIGRPILYKTTKEFLLRFGLKDVTELPSMEEFEKMAQLEFDEMEPSAEEGASTEANENSIPEVDDDPDEPVGESAVAGQQEEEHRTAAKVDSIEAPEVQAPDSTRPDSAGRAAETPAASAETSAVEDAPAAPSPAPEQAETETVPHD